MGTGLRSGLKSEVNDSEERWRIRIERARALQNRQQAIAPALRLYEATLEFQRDVASTSISASVSDVPLRKQIDLAVAYSKLPAILTVAQTYGPEALRRRAKVLEGESEPMWHRRFESALDHPIGGEIDDFFVRACLQPIAENLQSQMPSDRNYSNSICPACGGLPQLAVLRPEGDGASRSLLCSFCLREWLFRRIVCPFCAEEDKEKLPRYSAQECDYVHVEACDTCMHYLKAVDLSVDGHAVPLVDEAALAVLDVWASEHGYRKIVPNLMGL